MRRRTTANMCELKKCIYWMPIFRPAMQNFHSPEEVLHGRTKYWHPIYTFLMFAHICCCSSSHCGVPAFKLIHVLSLQASSDLTSDIGIVSFSSSIFFLNAIPAIFMMDFYIIS